MKKVHLIFLSIFLPLLSFGGVIENNISNVYHKFYPNINISKIIIKNYKNQLVNSIDTSNINIKKSSGTIKINNNRYIFYKIIAKVKVLKTTTYLSKNSILNYSNTKLSWIDFKNFYSYPILKYTREATKMYIPPNRIIYQYMITIPNMVSRGQLIDIISKSGGIEISFQAKAMQNGKAGERIKVKKDNRVFFVTIDKNGNGRL